jgi:hypothetical protein
MVLPPYFFWLFFLGILGASGLFVWYYLRHRMTSLFFPQPLPGQVRFEERRASGRSLNFRVMGRAADCLEVTVTDTEVWIRLSFPFSLLARRYGLEHRINRDSITRLQPEGAGLRRGIILQYRDPGGQTHELFLQLRKADDFLTALGKQPPLLPRDPAS